MQIIWRKRRLWWNDYLRTRELLEMMLFGNDFSGRTRQGGREREGLYISKTSKARPAPFFAIFAICEGKKRNLMNIHIYIIPPILAHTHQQENAEHKTAGSNLFETVACLPQMSWNRISPYHGAPPWALAIPNNYRARPWWEKKEKP